MESRIVDVKWTLNDPKSVGAYCKEICVPWNFVKLVAEIESGQTHAYPPAPNKKEVGTFQLMPPHFPYRNQPEPGTIFYGDVIKSYYMYFDYVKLAIRTIKWLIEEASNIHSEYYTLYARAYIMYNFGKSRGIEVIKTTRNTTQFNSPALRKRYTEIKELYRRYGFAFMK